MKGCELARKPPTELSDWTFEDRPITHSLPAQMSCLLRPTMSQLASVLEISPNALFDCDFQHHSYPSYPLLSLIVTQRSRSDVCLRSACHCWEAIWLRGSHHLSCF